MTTESSRLIDVIAKMIQLTQNKKIIWKSQEDSNNAKIESDDRINIVFATNYKTRMLRIYERIFKDYRPTSGFSSILRGDEPFWNREVILEFIDEQERALWTFPEMNIVDDLLSAVQYQVAGVKEFIDDILAEDLLRKPNSEVN